MSSKKICCGCDIFVFTKAFTHFEIGINFFFFFLSICNLFSNSEISLYTLYSLIECIWMVAWIVYLFLELYGLQKRKNRIIVIGCIIRCLVTLTVLILIFAVPFGAMDKIIEGHPDVANLVGQLNLSHSEGIPQRVYFENTPVDVYFDSTHSEVVKFVRDFIEVCLVFQLMYETYRTYLQIRVAILTVNGNEEILELPQYVNSNCGANVDSGKVYQITDSVMDVPPPPYNG